jgi:hypothetical protein
LIGETCVRMVIRMEGNATEYGWGPGQGLTPGDGSAAGADGSR